MTETYIDTKRKEKILKEISLAKNLFAFPNLEPELKDDIEIISAAITKNSQAIQFSSLRIRENESIILELLKINPYIYEYLEENHKDNFIIALSFLTNIKNKSVGILDILAYGSDKVSNSIQGIKSIESVFFRLQQCIEMEKQGFHIVPGNFENQLNAFNLAKDLNTNTTNKQPKLKL